MKVIEGEFEKALAGHEHLPECPYPGAEDLKRIYVEGINQLPQAPDPEIRAQMAEVFLKGAQAATPGKLTPDQEFRKGVLFGCMARAFVDGLVVLYRNGKMAQTADAYALGCTEPRDVAEMLKLQTPLRGEVRVLKGFIPDGRQVLTKYEYGIREFDFEDASKWPCDLLVGYQGDIIGAAWLYNPKSGLIVRTQIGVLTPAATWSPEQVRQWLTAKAEDEGLETDKIHLEMMERPTIN